MASEKYAPEEMINQLHLWETAHLAKVDAKRASMEFGMVSEALRKIGEQVQRRLNAMSQNKCFVCGHALVLNRIFNTRAVFDKITGNHINRYACSPKCDNKLEEVARNAMRELQVD